MLTYKCSSHNMKASEDFLCVVLYSHIITAAKVCVSEMSNQNQANCNELAKLLVEKFVNISLADESAVPSDSVYTYTYYRPAQ